MRNQTKVALLASILVFILGIAWYAAEWDYYSHRKILVTPPEYEYVEKTPMEITGSVIMGVICSLGAGLTAFAVIAPSGVLKDAV